LSLTKRLFNAPSPDLGEGWDEVVIKFVKIKLPHLNPLLKRRGNMKK